MLFRSVIEDVEVEFDDSKYELDPPSEEISEAIAAALEEQTEIPEQAEDEPAVEPTDEETESADAVETEERLEQPYYEYRFGMCARFLPCAYGQRGAVLDERHKPRR